MRRLLAGTGRVLITAGLLILLFVAYQLWGTGLYTARAQNRLEGQFQESLDAAPTRSTTPTAPTSSGPGTAVTSSGPGATATSVPSTTTTVPPPPSVPEGDAVAHLVIPRIGLDVYVVQGTDESDLRNGPGHYLATPLPGQVGNSAIAGHRTTYGAPFGDLDSLEPGDTIEVTTLQGAFEYRIYEKLVVAPTDTGVLDVDPNRPAVLSLTTCHPKYSAAERLIVKAELVIPPGSQPLPSSVDLDDPRVASADLGDALSGDSDSKLPTLIAGLIVALVGGLWWLLFHRHPRWTTWLIGAGPFLVSLAAFYYLLERLLPSNY